MAHSADLPRVSKEYVNAIAHADYNTVLISANDKLHNLRRYLQSPELVTPDVIEFYCQLYPHYEAVLDPREMRQFDKLVPKHPIVLEMYKSIGTELIPLYSAYWDDADKELIFTFPGYIGYIAISALPTVRVAKSTDLINNPWPIRAENSKLKLADGEFNAETLRQQKPTKVTELEIASPPEIRSRPSIPLW